jgi:hypothetical protein
MNIMPAANRMWLIVSQNVYNEKRKYLKISFFNKSNTITFEHMYQQFIEFL